MKSLNAKFAALYTFTYLAMGALLPIIGQYLKSMGFSGVQIGIVTALGTAVAILASGFWGLRFNKSRQKHLVLVFIYLMAAVMCMILINMMSFVAVLIVYGIMYFFQAPATALADSLTLERGLKFGVLRSFGAVGFAFGAFISGLISNETGLSSLFYIYTISFCLAAGTSYFMKGKTSACPPGGETPVVLDDKRNRGRRGIGEYINLMRNKKFASLIICIFFFGGTNVANNTYFGFLYTEGGGTIAGLGIIMLVMVGSEIPFMVVCESLSARFTTEKMILAAALVSAVRFLVYGTGLPWWGLFALSVSQGFVNGIMLIELVKYVAKLVPEGKKSLAISAYYIIGSSLSAIFCQAIGGCVLGWLGATQVYIFFGLFNSIGVVLYIAFGLYRSQ